MIADGGSKPWRGSYLKVLFSCDEI
jgi:hypothetical protein